MIVPTEQVEELARDLWGDVAVYSLPRERRSVEKMVEELAGIALTRIEVKGE